MAPVLDDGAIGVMVSIYYGLTGLACVWFYRRVLTANVGNLIMRGVWPLLSAVFLLFLGAKQLPDHRPWTWAVNQSARRGHCRWSGPSRNSSVTRRQTHPAGLR